MISYHLLRAMRPRQWIKNLLVFVALIFAQKMGDARLVALAILAFIAFCALSSATYLLNDLVDLERDRRHPKKRFRPLASGALSPQAATTASFVLTLAAYAIGASISLTFACVLAAYHVLSMAYSYRLKNVVILDILAVSAMFVLRAIAGAVAVAVEISPWLVVCTTFLALFLVINKRRNELILLEAEAIEHRETLGEYSPLLLDQMSTAVTAATIISYALYTLDPATVAKVGSHGLELTIPFVLFGVFRYMYLSYQRDEGGAPERVLLTDRPLLVAVLLWVLTAVLVMYLGKHMG